MAGLEGLLAGRVLGGRYLIEEVIGRGGMGAVYQALDERLGRRVAVKVITLSGDDPTALERLRARFHREARAAAALPHHPNVVPVYDYGTDEPLGLDYIVMELLRGQDLATRLTRSDAPPLSTALRILVQAVRGVAVGHRSGLIHRDVKPGNLFLTRGDANETQVRVVDFGIAKLMDDEDTTGQLTQDGRPPHSPAFASPEQLRGLLSLKPASDVFSLGAVGYVLLTGQRPFTDSDRNRMSLGMPVPVRPLRTTHPAVPVGVEAVVMKALAFDAKDRYPDATAMLEALETAIREIGDRPLEPYIPSSPGGPPDLDTTSGGEDQPDERTQLLPEDDHTHLLDAPSSAGATPSDEGTLAAPPPAPAPASAPPTRATGPAEGQVARAFPPRRPLERPRRSRMGVVVWLLVLATLAGVAYWAYTIVGDGRDVVTIPPPPADIEGIGEPTSVDLPAEPGILDAIEANRLGNNAYNSGQRATAADHYRMAVQIDPESAVYRRNLALALLHTEAAEEAVTQLTRAVRLDPTLLLAQYDLSRAYLAVGDTTAALDWLANFIDRSINDSGLVTARIAAINARQRLLESRTPALPRNPAPVDTTSPTDGDTTAPPATVLDSITPVIPAGGDG